MSHIRNHIVTEMTGLLSDNISLGTRVFNQRVPTARVIPTYVMVYFDSEVNEKLTIHPVSAYRCIATVHVDSVFRVSDYEDLESAIGNLAEEVQTILTSSALMAVSQAVKDLALVQTTVSLDEEQRAYATMQQVWQVTYVMMEGNPTFV